MSVPIIMGIVNVTPDSFSGDGLLPRGDYLHSAVDQALRMLSEGAAILDIGGESSRPGATPVTAEEELRRVVPVIADLHRQAPNAVIAVDTVKASVAQAALDAGATIINDITALQGDAAMAKLVAERGCRVVLMHNRSDAKAVTQDARLGGQYQGAPSADIVEDVKRDLSERITVARAAGIADDKIILDPGIGFGKTVEQNLVLIRDVARLKQLGYPIMIGASRKGFIGKILDATVDNRLEGTLGLMALATLSGADILRVHDITPTLAVAKVAASARDAKA